MRSNERWIYGTCSTRIPVACTVHKRNSAVWLLSRINCMHDYLAILMSFVVWRSMHDNSSVKSFPLQLVQWSQLHWWLWQLQQWCKQWESSTVEERGWGSPGQTDWHHSHTCKPYLVQTEQQARLSQWQVQREWQAGLALPIAIFLACCWVCYLYAQTDTHR